MNVYKIIGLMSGTSMDGLDIAYCTFQNNGRWQYDMPECCHVPYPDDLYKSIMEIYTGTAAELTEIDHKLGSWVGKQVARFMEERNVHPELIVSHGQTVFHRPELGYTLQIGNGWSIWKHCGIPVINDLRSADMVLGGQGAPLVPMGDHLLFDEYDFCLNIGGFSNISYEVSGGRIAFDISPVNVVLNLLSQRLGKPYDEGGKIAASGNMDIALFERLNALSFYHEQNPKSLGMEWADQYVLPMMGSDKSADILLHTFTRHAAYQIAQSISRAGLQGQRRVLVTGGGTYNDFLIDCMSEYTGGQTRFIVPDPKLIDFKEALVFGFLGLLKKLNKVNVYAYVTGAQRDTSGGVLYSG